MGFFDFQPSEDELAFANFDAGLASSVSSSASASSSKDKSFKTNLSTDMAPSQTSDSSRNSTDKKASAETSLPSSSTKPTFSASTAIKNPRARRRRRTSSFDLYGDDEELQHAEASINFCEICLKHCDIH